MDVQNDILDYLGSEATVEMLRAEFGGLNLSQIKSKLDQLFPGDDNAKLANKINDYLN